MSASRLAKLGFFSSLMLSLLAVVPLQAQRGPAMGPRGMSAERAQLEMRVRARMAEMMRERLGLSEEDDARLSTVVEQFVGQRRQLAREQRGLRRRVEELRLDRGQDQSEAAELLQRMAALRMQEAELYQAEQEALLEILTPVQVLHYVSMRDLLGERLQRIRGGQSGRSGGRGGVGRSGSGRGPIGDGNSLSASGPLDGSWEGRFSPER